MSSIEDFIISLKKRIIGQKAIPKASPTPVPIPPPPGTTEQLLAKILDQLVQINTNTLAFDTGELPGAGWITEEYNGQLPGRATNVIMPGDSVTLINKEDEEGEFFSAFATMDNPYLTFTLELKAPDGTWNPTVFSIFFLNQVGHNVMNTTSPYVTRYDTANSVYSVSWTPGFPIPYKGVRGYIQNPPYQIAITPNGFVPNPSAPNTPVHLIHYGLIRRVFSEVG